MTQFTSRAYHHWQGLCAHALLGALAGMLLLYPVTKAIYGAEWHSARSEVERLALAFTPSMLPMTGAFALLDGARPRLRPSPPAGGEATARTRLSRDREDD